MAKIEIDANLVTDGSVASAQAPKTTGSLVDRRFNLLKELFNDDPTLFDKDFFEEKKEFDSRFETEGTRQRQSTSARPARTNSVTTQNHDGDDQIPDDDFISYLEVEKQKTKLYTKKL